MSVVSESAARILVVSGEDLTRILLCARLAADGHHVWVAASVMQAQHLLQEHEPEILVIDEDVDGTEQLEDIAEQAGCAVLVSPLDPFPTVPSALSQALGPAELDRHISSLLGRSLAY